MFLLGHPPAMILGLRLVLFLLVTASGPRNGKQPAAASPVRGLDLLRFELRQDRMQIVMLSRQHVAALAARNLVLPSMGVVPERANASS
ncbi:hypothetical protein GGTG_08284 [Gaeumannomyces tritici R3-111a-1]|uniref:Secreted protein n=1 Tax=Gaeumannomyces tritici (strain R3-111a-1) TaxID=644352 RepID=J3P448_GAET3|nr:hypothetical protein GGTG_08284 [Gaeumannomyces tritici R3-111a-1]EJT74444.1 hypothetical protein GGTG_08284 [Gaeumannomyces tritici R3-111a-1]